MTSLQKIREQVQQEFAGLLAVVEGDTSAKWVAVERALWWRLLALGRALALLYLTRVVARPRSARYEFGGESFTIDCHVRIPLGTRFGKIAWRRPAAHRDHGRGQDLPVDRELGLCGGFSLGVVTSLVKLTAQMAFEAARRSFTEVYGWAPSPRTLLRMVDGLAAKCQSFHDQAAAPPDEAPRWSLWSMARVHRRCEVRSLHVARGHTAKVQNLVKSARRDAGFSAKIGSAARQVTSPRTPRWRRSA